MTILSELQSLDFSTIQGEVACIVYGLKVTLITCYIFRRVNFLGLVKSAIEKDMIQRVKATLSVVGLNNQAEKIVSESKQETLSLVSDLSKSNLGTLLVANQAHVDARAKYSIFKENIEKYWNVGLFLSNVVFALEILLTF
jgi:hypothetical protein